MSKPHPIQFKPWLLSSVYQETENIPAFIPDLFLEKGWEQLVVEAAPFDPRFDPRDGWRWMDPIKYGPHAGKPGWFNFNTKKIVPADSPNQTIPQQTLGNDDEYNSRRQRRERPNQETQFKQQMPQPFKKEGKTPISNFETEIPWIKCVSVEGNPFNLPAGERMIARQEFDDVLGKELPTWEIADAHLRYKENISKTEIGKMIKALRSPEGKPLATNNPKEYLNPKSKTKSRRIPKELISEEQQDAEDKFRKMMESPEQSHMMLSALAATGKTTMLKHLADVFLKPGQSWLYLVFNTKNKVEAKEAFPESVQVKTTNGFLGEVLKSRENKAIFPQTDRMIDLKNNDDDDDNTQKKLEKNRIIAESPQFNQLINNLVGSTSNIKSFNFGKTEKTFVSLTNSIRYNFKEQVLKLLGLAKSYATDPRNNAQVQEKLESIISDHDIDTPLSDVKERINKYDGYFQTRVISGLQQILGYDFMTKDYKQEMKQTTEWLLNVSMPHKTDLKHKVGNHEYDLGKYRDFTDDLWYASVHSSEIHWPHYDVVFADEVQDFNENQKIMLDKLIDNGAKVVVVGDENQSLYRFLGADSEAFKNIGDMLSQKSHDKDIHRTLTNNFRSRDAIIDFANQATHVHNLKQGRVYKDNYGGEVTNGSKEYKDAFADLKREKDKYGYMQSTAFISRTNEPLVHAALKLLTDNIPFIIVGKDIATDLKKHIQKVAGRFGVKDDDSVDLLAEKLNELRNSEIESYGEQDVTKTAYLQELNETTNAILAAMEQFKKETPETPKPASQRFPTRPTSRYQYDDYDEEPEEHSGPPVKEFKRWIYQRLGGLDVAENEKDLQKYREKIEKENPVILTTAHKAKGLEWDRVFILRNDLFPHPKAKRPKDLAQESNAKFVAYTRPHKILHILKLDGQPGFEPPDPD